MKVIGLGHRTQGLIGWHLIMTESGSLTVTGTEIAAGLNMTTAGTTTDAVILTVTMTGTTTAASSAHTIEVAPQLVNSDPASACRWVAAHS
jgi:hypothetical protein